MGLGGDEEEGVSASLAPNSPGAAKPDSYMKQLAATRDIAGLDVGGLWNAKVEMRTNGEDQQRGVDSPSFTLARALWRSRSLAWATGVSVCVA